MDLRVKLNAEQEEIWKRLKSYLFQGGADFVPNPKALEQILKLAEIGSKTGQKPQDKET